MNCLFRYPVAILFVLVIGSNADASLLLGNDPLPEAPKSLPSLEGAERVGADFAAGRQAMKEHFYYEALAHFSSALAAAPNQDWKAAARGATGDAHLAIAARERMEGRLDSQRRHAVKASEFYRLLRQGNPESFPAKRALWKMGQAMMILQLYLEAEGWLEHAASELASDPYRVPVQLARAQNYLEWGNVQAAEPIFGHVMDSGVGDMDMADAVFGAAAALHGLKEYRRAYAYFTGGMKQWSNRLLMHPQLLFAFGEAAMVSQKYRRARWAYLSVYNRYPNSEHAATALARIGDTYRFQDEPRAAACFYQQAIGYPKGSDGRLLGLMGKARLSVSLIRNDPVDISNTSCKDGAVDTENALQEVYREVIANAPEHPIANEARMGLAESLSVTGHTRDAIAEYKPLVLETDGHPWKVTAGKKFDAEIRTLIDAHSEQGEDLRVVELYYQYRSVLPFVEQQQQEDGMQVASSLQGVGLLSSAQEVYRDILTSSASDDLKAESLRVLADAYLEAGEDGQAERLLVNYVAAMPDGQYKASMRQRLGDAKFRLGSYRDAIAPYRAWNLFLSQSDSMDRIAMFPSLLRLAEAYQRGETDVEGTTLLTELAGWAWAVLDQLSTSDLIALSDLLYRSDNLEAALRFYRHLLAREGEEHARALGKDDRDWVTYRVGRCLTSLDQVAEAKKAFRQLIDRDTGSHVSKLAAAYLARLELQS